MRKFIKPEKIFTIAKFNDYIRAELAKQSLADFGIKAILTGQNAANVYSGIPMLATVELQVFQSQAEKALEILGSTEKQEQ